MKKLNKKISISDKFKHYFSKYEAALKNTMDGIKNGGFKNFIKQVANNKTVQKVSGIALIGAIVGYILRPQKNNHTS